MTTLLLYGSAEGSPALRHEVPSRAVARLGIREAVVPGEFPVALADRLRADGLTITVDDAFVGARRRVKQGAELEGVRAAQAATDATMARAAQLLASCGPDAEGNLRLDGEVLLAERVRELLRLAFAEQGCTCPAEMIVASARNGFGHDPGTGPLPAGLPIQVDIFPRHEASGCWADMTRTFLVGEPAAGDAPLIAVHEPPGLGLSGSEPLVAGDVLAIEPGLWDRRIGGVRFEDLLLVTADGSETLTRFSYALTPGA